MTDYWHFAQVDTDGVPRLAHGDGREIRIGETLTVEGPPVLCQHGLHASSQILDALRYTQQGDGLVLCRVTLGGIVLHDDDKSVATERTVVAMLAASETDALLREFARWCALQVIHQWDAPGVVRQYLETGDESLRAAAGDAAWNAAWDAAEAAAWNAAEAAAWNAAWDAARDAQEEQLRRLFDAALERQEAGGCE